LPGFDPAIFSIYKLITFGGAPTPEEVLKVIGRSGARMVTIYGQTETTSCAACSPEGVSWEVMSSTIGRELDGVQIRIAAGDGQEMGTGEVGEIQIKGPCVMSGYHRNEQATREAFTSDGFLKTGDLGLRRNDGFITVVGRLKEMFKSGGYNVYPLEVENAINQYPGVQLSVVVPMPDEKYQEVGFAFVVPSGAVEIDPDALTAYLKERIANYKVPKQFSVVREVPLLTGGKVDRKKLREDVKAGVFI
jgi:acyl-CoA synthetase (AMP-forming)/AMP-acid ligase II